MAIDSRTRDDALRSMTARHRRALINVASRYECDVRDIEEMVADVFELANRHLDMLLDASDAHVRNWLLRCVRFLAINHVRRALTRKRAFTQLARDPLPLSPPAEDEYMEFEETQAAAALSRQVAEAMMSLEVPLRTAPVMNARGANSAEIGAALGTTANGARKRLQRAREALRAAYAANATLTHKGDGRAVSPRAATT